MVSAFQDLLVHIGAFVFVLGLVVFVHEFGHFQVARWTGVAIDTFAIGFGQRMFGWRDRHGVEWKVGSLPLGGYVKFLDDCDPSSTVAAQPPLDPAARAEARRRGLFHAQPVWVRAAVAVAGPAANFIFAIAAFAALLMVIGRDVTPVADLNARVDQIQTNSAAARAGIRPGDIVVAVDNRGIERFGALQDVIAKNAGKPLKITVRRGTDLITVTATPDARKAMDEEGAEHVQGILGIARTTLASERRIEKLGPIAAIGVGAEQTWRIVASTGGYVANIFTGRASAEHIAGPLGILDMSGQVAKVATQGKTPVEQIGNLFVGLIGWAATLSVAVGIVNLLPIPILDGGHLLFYAIETVRGKPLDAKAQLIGFKAGLALLGSLFLFATWNDLQRLNVLEFLRGMLS
jgi:regulator of sigma E protease